MGNSGSRLVHQPRCHSRHPVAAECIAIQGNCGIQTCGSSFESVISIVNKFTAAYGDITVGPEFGTVIAISDHLNLIKGNVLPGFYAQSMFFISIELAVIDGDRSEF
jgi:hypothetical protein